MEKDPETLRRHRLAEVLLHNVLHVSDDAMEQTACQVDHVLNPEVTNAVCTFLGHPPVCPHNREIPRGSCCSQASSPKTLIVPLSKLTVGEKGTVAFIYTKRHAYLGRLSSMGLAPGSQIRLRQSRPTWVIGIGETDLALDSEAGNEIFVRCHSKPNA